MTRQYGKPPLIEAICKFRFDGEDCWDARMPGLIWEMLREDYPISKDSTRTKSNLKKVESKVELEGHTSQKTRFYNQSESIFIQVSQNSLSIHNLTPYEGWESFLPRVKQAYAVFVELVKPEEIDYVGVRYINEFVFDTKTTDVESLLNNSFTFKPMVLSSEMQSYTRFITGIRLPLEHPEEHLTVTLAANRPSENDREELVVSLDLDYHSHAESSVRLNSVFDLLETAHTKIETVFESCLKDSMRQSFEAL